MAELGVLARLLVARRPDLAHPVLPARACAEDRPVAPRVPRPRAPVDANANRAAAVLEADFADWDITAEGGAWSRATAARATTPAARSGA
ncbi:hypothetical protein [Streptomonospora arabica]|uniref:Uncharacterized protein n=1 Tax=Streptomonospora arabica TaxID=412417 RepID=A0ABV9SN91_9ACTN